MKRKEVFFHRSALALANAQRSPEILQALAQHGVDQSCIEQLQTQLLEVQQLDQRYYDAAAEAKAATQSLYAVRSQAQLLYGQHVLLGRIALKDQPVLQEKMALHGIRKKGLAEWMTQANSFYRHAPSVKGALAKFNVTTKELNEMQKLLNQMVEIQRLQFQLKGQMQVISEQKKQAYAALQKSISRFFRIARIALEEEPQHLETLGLVVKATA